MNTRMEGGRDPLAEAFSLTQRGRVDRLPSPAEEAWAAQQDALLIADLKQALKEGRLDEYLSNNMSAE